jgi:indolepyruvate ferredoxin oxidoreductase
VDFAKAVVVGAFKLMAYKDEYEVARLHRDQSFRKKLAEQFEGDFRIRHHLAPPMISRIDPRTGYPGKIAFGAWINPVFAVLARLKGLRGTRFDPFGSTQERRMERRLVADYESLIPDLSARLTQGNLAVATELARLPEEVRGFGHVKMAAVERFEAKKKALLGKLEKESRLETAA